MSLFGPLVHFWSAFGERKNKELKDWANIIRSNKNLPVSIAIRHQLFMAHFWKFEKKGPSRLERGPVEDDQDFEVRHWMPNVEHAKSLYHMTINGNKYHNDSDHAGSIIIVGTEKSDEGPEFAKIYKIFDINGKISLIFKKIHRLCFDEHYFAYEVTVTEKVFKIMTLEELPRIFPCLLTQLNDNYYVSMRHINC